MTSFFSKFESEVQLLFSSNTSILEISNILDYSRRSIYNTLYRIKKKEKTFSNKKELDLGRPKKITLRIKRVINRDIIKNLKKTNKSILLDNNIDLSKRSLQNLLKEQG